MCLNLCSRLVFFIVLCSVIYLLLFEFICFINFMLDVVVIDEKFVVVKYRIINLCMVIILLFVLCSYCDSVDCVLEFKK